MEYLTKTKINKLLKEGGHLDFGGHFELNRRLKAYDNSNIDILEIQCNYPYYSASKNTIVSREFFGIMQEVSKNVEDMTEEANKEMLKKSSCGFIHD